MIDIAYEHFSLTVVDISLVGEMVVVVFVVQTLLKMKP